MTFTEWLIESDFVEHLDKDWPEEARSLFECVSYLKSVGGKPATYRLLVKTWQEYKEDYGENNNL